VWDRGHHYAGKLLQQGGPIYALTLPEGKWAAVKRRLGRLGGRYVRIDQGGAYAVLTTAPLPLACELDARAAVGRLGEHLRALERRPCAARGKPVLTSSKGWKPPPRPKGGGTWQRVGAVHVSEPGPVVELLASKGIRARVRPAAEDPVWLVEWVFPASMSTIDRLAVLVALEDLRDPGDVPW
jgi:hypothetical protein